MSRNFSHMWRKILRYAFKKSLLHSHRNDLRKTVLLKTNFLVKKFNVWANFFFILVEKFQKFYQNCILYTQRRSYRLLSKLYSTCLGNFLRNINCLKKMCFHFFFWSLIGSFSDFWFNLSRNGFQKWILHHQNKILRRCLLWNHSICWYFRVLSSNFPGFLWKKPKQCCQNCILIVQRNILGFGKFE